MPSSPHIRVLFQPQRLEVRVSPGTTILEAARRAGIQVTAPCGGMGTCGACRVQPVEGRLSPPSPEEIRLLGKRGIARGERLACRAELLGDARVYLPPASLSAPQRAQVDILLERGLEPGEGEEGLGVALDAGTTGLAAYLVDLATGKTLLARGAPNPQIALGEDVISRIRAASADAAAARRLRESLVQGLAELVEELLRETGRTGKELQRITLVGNPAMTHLFLGLPVDSLGTAPYAPASTDPVEIPASQAGLPSGKDTVLRIPPAVAGFVGADHLAMILATGLHESKSPAAGMDIGTNTEVALVKDGRIWSCSTASGPAFEGARIRCGMRASPGAVEKVSLREGVLTFSTIEGRLPLGICGSGVLDALAALVEEDFLLESGRFKKKADSRLGGGEGGPRFELIPPALSGHGEPLFLTRKDIQEIQVAKGAMRAGLDVLLDEAGMVEEEIETFFLAGAFGTYLDLESARAVGMVPPLPTERFRQVGNAAGAGARAVLGDRAWREILEIAGKIRYVELAGTERFTEAFAERMLLPRISTKDRSQA